MLEPDIIYLQPKILAGKQQVMSLVNNKTGLLWQGFMQQRNQLVTVDALLYSLQVYDATYFSAFDPANEFTKWALSEIKDEENLPEGFETFHLTGGLYAVFHHTGSGAEIFQEIFAQWLPQSGYVLDDRPHFELLGEKYRNNSNDSEEDIYIPVKSS